MSSKLKKAQYYVWYVGWKECKGLAGREFTEHIVRELLQRRSYEELPKLTIEVSKKELKVVQLVEKKKGKIDKVKYPSIPSRDITYAVQALPPYEDVLACIYLGYNQSTKSAVHVHVYRCDSPDTAAIFVNHLDLIIQIPDNQLRIRKIEEELARKGHIALRPPTRLEGYLQHNLPPQQPNIPSNNGQAYYNGDYRRKYEDSINSDHLNFTVGSGSTSSGSDPHSPRSPEIFPPSFQNMATHSMSAPMNDMPSPNTYYEAQKLSDRKSGDLDQEQQQQAFDSLAAELKSKLGKEPLLLPPKDYDTIHRKRGNTFDLENRKCLNKEIIGNLGVYDPKVASSENSDQIGNNNYIPLNTPTQGNLPKRGSSSSFGRNSSNADDEELSAISPRGYSKKGLRRLSSGDTNNSSNPDDPYSSQTRPFSPGPFTQELQQNSYFPQKTGQELPNYLHRSRGSYNSLNHSRQSSGDQSMEDIDRRIDMQPGSKYTASNLGIIPKKKLTKQQSSPEFGQRGYGSGYQRQRSNDEGYTSSDRQEFDISPPRSGISSGSNPFQSDSDIDLAASMPAMKINEFNSRRQNAKEYKDPARVYVDDHDPAAYVPIDYTVAVRGLKERKAIPQ